MKIMENRNLMILALLGALVIGVVVGVALAYEFDIYKPEIYEQGTELPIYENITVQQSHSLILNNTNNSGFVLLDVRTPEEFADGYIEGAINLDYFNESFSDVLGILDTNKTYLVYCGVGGRSGQSLAMMKELEFKEVYNMVGGLSKWKEEGFETVEG